MFDGVAPSMSVSTSTPSPSSSCRTSSCAWGSIASGSSCTVTPTWRTRNGRFPSTWLAQWISASPNAPWATIRIPTMAKVLRCQGKLRVYPRESFPGAPPGGGGLSRGRLHGRLERLEERRGDVEAALLGDLLEAGRARDVDLGQPVADDVEPDEQQPATRERGSDGRCDLAVARRKRSGDAGAARGQVAARLAGLRNPRERVGHGLAGDQEHALVAVTDLGDVALRHDRARAVPGERLDDDVAVGVAVADAEHARAAVTLERLEHDVALRVDEALELSFQAGHDRRHDELRELRDRELLAVVADRARIVEHACALACRRLEEP